ncbi:MAG: porin family protein [Alphaproteobacteria bacterium]|nr:porin family protein [Alphaproteobacteria bacterium]
MKKVLLLAGLAGMVAANAEAINVTPYVGLDANYSMLDSDSGSKLSSKSWSAAPVIGARTDRFGLEGSYDYGMREHKQGNASRYTKYAIDALAFQPLGCSGRWEGVASAGVTFNRVDRHGPFESDHGYGERLGAGLQYALTDKTAVRAMYHYNWIHQSYVNNANEVSLGLRHSF